VKRDANSDVDLMLRAIEAWVWDESTASAEYRLEVGIWDLAAQTWYALVRQSDGCIVVGEETYGADGLIAALTALRTEIENLEEA